MLEQAAARLQARLPLWERFPAGVAEFDREGRVLAVNPAFCRMLGRRREELVGRRHDELLHPADVLPTANAEGELKGEVRYLAADGSSVWVELTGSRDADGADTIVVAMDVTDRRDTEQALQVALEASRTGTFRWDIRRNTLSWDNALDKLFGLEPGQSVRSLAAFIDRVHPDDRAGVIERCERCRDEAADFDMEYRVVHPDGSLHWLYDRGRTVTDSAGVALYMTGACVDVTDRKRVQDALRESEVFYRQTVESVPGMTYICREDGYCTYLSEQWGRFTGVPVEHHLGRNWTAALHPDDAERAGALWDDAVRSGQPYVTEYRMRRNDGSYRWFKAQGRRIGALGQAAPLWIGTVVDVDDLKATQAALQERERELQSIADNSPDAIARFDSALRHVFVSAAIEGFSGRAPQEFIGRTNRELGLPEALCELWDEALLKVFTLGEPQAMQFQLAREGKVVHFASRLVPERDASGRVVTVLGVTRDVTQAWEAQEALRRADRQKDDFLATLAHELRNPLAPIRTGLAVLQNRGGGSAEERRVREIMDRQLKHLVRLVDELLDIARISQGKIVLDRELLPLHAVIEHALDACRPGIEAQGHQLEVIAGETDWFVNGDETRLVQVFGNLLNNAAKYTPRGGRIVVRAAREGNELRVSVQDTGLGIPAAMLDRVFERFVQADQHLSRAQGGLGIGLSVVRSLVEMHGGRVAAESAGPGAGSRFTVWLPRAQPATVAPIAVREDDAAASAQPRKVLIVDDNRDAAETLSMIIEMSGHSVRVAPDGPAGLAAASEYGPDVVLLDIGMPGMSGYEVAARLRQMPGARARRLVALTGWGSEEDRARSLAAGFDVHLTKPVGLDQITALLAPQAAGDRG